jgi:acetyl esterase/lipase
MTDSSDFDRGLFDPETIDSETAAFNERVEKELSALPPTYTVRPELIRKAREEGKSIWGPIRRLDEAQNRVVPGPAGDVPIRVIIPDRVNGVYLHIHGGGFMLGRADQFDERIAEVAHGCDVAVVSVDYRLAPEDPYPAGPDDCEAAALWLAKNSKSEFGSNRLVIGGESAGANLSAVTLLRMRDRHSFTGFAGANLIYGAYDLTMTPSVRRWGEKNLILTTKLIEWFHNNYVPEGKLADPDVSPLYAVLSDMPPALFTIGTLDPLLDDSLFMHARWLAAGSRAELAIYPGGIHAFNAFPIELARRANARIIDFIAEAIKEQKKQ